MSKKPSKITIFANLKSSGCSVARLSRLVWDQKVASSNLATPTYKISSSLNSRFFFDLKTRKSTSPQIPQFYISTFLQFYNSTILQFYTSIIQYHHRPKILPKSRITILNTAKNHFGVLQKVPSNALNTVLAIWHID